ncbi:ferredoxin--NADP reductase [Colwellia sp. MB02u-9]|uniref:ferredoxin--NADP reductase n=1 Tax=Colwellia sp. MB02u-9 TaxID=2759823 RepID=UPI0015F6D8DA|nr:ferredoxin--NADP reductase [Colwellia sp. MB02u-9]MBA6295809.1 ferredoxin--NADP reductase [Colwellia sp. MB02u-9]
MQKKFNPEKVIDVVHWNDSLFSFKTTRSQGLRFRNGEYIIIGLAQENTRPILRAYSLASANHEDYLEFFSIKVEGGAFTSKLQHLAIGDEVIIGSKPTGTLVIDDLRDGRNLLLVGTGTGLAPFLSIIKDPETYQRFDKVILFHGVRYVNELAYHKIITTDLPHHEYLGEMITEQLIYYPSVTRESYKNEGRITDLIKTGKLCLDIGIPDLDPEFDRVMLCGSPAMLKDTCAMLDERGFQESRKKGVQGDYVVERAFVEK